MLARSSVSRSAASTQRTPDDVRATDPLESPEACLALIASLADGERHLFGALAQRLHGDVLRIRTAIEHFHRLGMPLVIDEHAVRATRFVALDQRMLERGLPHWDTRVVGSTDSTSDDLLRALRGSAPHRFPALLTCEVQHAGRGRLGRRWQSAPSVSLTASFAFHVGRGLAMLDGITLVCGLAVRDAVAAHGVDSSLKWPNDLLFDDRKVAGILVEAHAVGSTTAIVVGVGINVAARTAPTDSPAAVDAGLPSTDLACCGADRGDDAIDRNRLLVDIAVALERRLQRFDATGFAAFVDEWNAADAFRDRAVRLASGGLPRDDGPDTPCGVARGVDATGALLVDVDGVTTRVISGDLSLRPGTATR